MIYVSVRKFSMNSKQQPPDLTIRRLLFANYQTQSYVDMPLYAQKDNEWNATFAFHSLSYIVTQNQG